MTISYNWLCEYIPVNIDPETISKILTSVGLEVESMDRFEEITGGLKGLIVGEVLECEKHPDADKLKITKVNIGNEMLQIVCGAPNVSIGQKVIVAPVGSTIFPINSEPLIMKRAKIRGIESYGMICAEDEIGLGISHEGILVLPQQVDAGSFVCDYYKPVSDFIYEIGLTPNHMDAMSHLGVAKDICAWYSHHHNLDIQVKQPFSDSFLLDQEGQKESIKVSIADPSICARYCGICISDISITNSPKWLVERLNSIGIKSINNVVDVTNFILHESGQPLHAFDLDKIRKKEIIVQQVAEGTSFITLDGKVRKLFSEDIMICDGDQNPMCLGGVFGGSDSGVSEQTTSIFLESANFNSQFIRKTLVRHSLRTEAAIRFEKGVDISKTLTVLKRAALLITELCKGRISSSIIDIYPAPKFKNKVILTWDYLKKISGKYYEPTQVKRILERLGFEIESISDTEISMKVPFSNPDISIPADIVEEILRIDGLDNILIPETISISPSIEKMAFENDLKEKIATYLVGNGFSEILTNSITNSAYYQESELERSVKIINSLSVELDILKPQMLETALETVAFNLNRKSSELYFFEFGKTYSYENGNYSEKEHLLILISANNSKVSWKAVSPGKDIYYLKGLSEVIGKLSGVTGISFKEAENENFLKCLEIYLKKQRIGKLGNISKGLLNKFSIKQPVFCLDFNWLQLIMLAKNNKVVYEEITKYPTVYRELSIVVDKYLPYEKLEKVTLRSGLQKLKETRLLNVFESEKLGIDKKSFALSYTFLDKEKTMTDNEIDVMMEKLIVLYEKELDAQIRRG